mmetsp:Transcript_24800/g.52856  ORF Transcript_24800/g.52856 Transcript_24800/m.52856 type:complete len:202 (-) Transcript_24800:165-770(-)|eukprot:CAMPEP_0172535528 /NCGR_PEP_ID=MMETSP1067-20121228/7498_1 /TAXON_ID=265564 ORGANISM="Thalassiosira punctigera, Strain Tpunct2005C2" /NCGR_SAMPLE_ID=MMETSP1067 /ASSEMBLY_ACC=CAM_ASM_000444 /LENGTH=201 /DNA_ID=CAMNT_0013320465 /DNA_START=148 /DNA_END=753 /DNA_ORIENTATION=-
MSGQYGEPDWANATNTPATVADTGASAAASSSGGGWATGIGATSNANAAGASNVSRSETNCFQRLLSLFSMGLSAMMCCLGVFGIMDKTELPEIFVSLYMILFAVLLFLYELMWWTSIDAVNKNLRMNFGFLYGVKGRALYLIFVAFLVIGLKDDVSVKFLRYMTGGCFLGTGVLMLFIHFAKPDVLGDYQAPTAGFDNPV